MPECIFCEIVKKKIPVRTVYEDDYSIAFLDITPRSKGMCLVLPKQHFSTFDENTELANNTFNAAMTVGKKLTLSLNPLAVFFSVMQAKIPHFHIRVYPVYEDQIPLIENKPIEIDESELDELTKKINSVEIKTKKSEPEMRTEPKVVERKRTDSDKYWLKRSQEVA